METITITLLIILFSILTYLIQKAWKVNQFWKERGIPHIKPWLFIGNTAPLIRLQKNAAQIHKDACDQFPNEPFVGFYELMKPVLLIKDPQWIENILIKDFSNFTDHGFEVDEKHNPLEISLFTLSGKRWKACRNKLSPIFTTGKLKLMYNLMSNCADELIAQLEMSEEVEMRDFLGRYSIDVIGSCAFGIEANTLSNPENEFNRMGKKVFQMGFINFIKFIIILSFPPIIKFIKISLFNADVTNFFTGIISDTLKYRRRNNYKRNDLVQLLMQLQDKGYVEIHTKDSDDDYLNINETLSCTEKFELSNEELIGQAFSFLTSGFEFSTIAMTYLLYELSINTEIQEKVREEIKKWEKTAGSLTYDAIREMQYLEQCLKETMRKYPPALVIMRSCTKEYILPNGTKLELNQPIMVPLHALHHDPKYYPEPEIFKPERFDPGNNIPPYAYLPFGNGPRMCIAMRFAMLEMKICIAKLLLNFKFTLNSKTKEPLTMDVKKFFTSPNEVVIFNVKKIPISID